MIKHIRDAFAYNNDGLRWTCHCNKCDNSFETTNEEEQYDCPKCGGFLKVSTKERVPHKKCKCGEDVDLTDCIADNTCECLKCHTLYNCFGQELEPLENWDKEDIEGTFNGCDSFDEISKAVKHKKGELKHKEIKMPTSAAKKLGQALNGLVADSREYIGEYNDVYYERYRGITIYKVQTKAYEFEYVAQFLDKEYSADTAKALREKLDEVISEYVEKYAKDFDIKKEGK